MPLRIRWTVRPIGEGVYEGSLDLPIPRVLEPLYGPPDSPGGGPSSSPQVPSILRDLTVRASGPTPGDAPTGVLCHADDVCGALENMGFFNFAELIPSLINKGARIATSLAEQSQRPGGIQPGKGTLSILQELARPATSGEVLGAEDTRGLRSMMGVLTRPEVWTSGARPRNAAPAALAAARRRRQQEAARKARMAQARARARALVLQRQQEQQEPEEELFDDMPTDYAPSDYAPEYGPPAQYGPPPAWAPAPWGWQG